MAPKRRDRDRHESVSLRRQRAAPEPEDDEDAISNPLRIRNVNLLEANAFTRPTRIYRFLAERHKVAPLFLNRTLTYMRQRLSRTSTPRRNFEIDSMLNKIQDNSANSECKYLTVTFMGYYDSTRINGGNDHVKVETLVVKYVHNKRKGATPPPVKLSIGTSEIPINPGESVSQQVPIISISPETINVSNLRGIKQYKLVIRVLKENSSPCVESEGGSSCTSLEGGLLIYSKNSCQPLSNGDYDLRLYESSTQGRQRLSLPGWTPITSIDDQEALVPITTGPTIKFRLTWTTEQKSGWVERPIPRIHDVASGDNKENDPSGKNPSRCVRPVLRSSTAAGTSVPKEEIKRPLCYNLQLNQTTSMLTESDRDYICPWCNLNCMNVYPLLKHLKLTHARFNFFYTTTDDNGIRITVTVNDSFDGSYEGNPVDLIRHGSAAFSADGPVRRAPVTKLIVCKPKRLKHTMSEFADIDGAAELDIHRTSVTGHNRLYYHTTTCLPIYPEEMDNDSEGEKDPKWLKEKTIMMIDDFTDVNEGEKEIMKMWNLHIMKYGFVGDCQVPLACAMFIEQNGREIFEKNLVRNFALHLCCLFDFGLLNPQQVHESILKLQEIDQTGYDFLRRFADIWLEQRSQWLKSGSNGGSRDKTGDKFPACSANQTSFNPRLASSSTFIAGDGTLRRKMTQQTPQNAKKERRIATTVTSKSAPVHVENDEEEVSTKTKRKLALEDREGAEPAKRKRSGSMPTSGTTSQSSGPTRRKSSATAAPP